MNYEQMQNEIEKYKDTMTDEERNKAYAEGKEVDRIPFSMPITESQAELYGYTLGEYRRSAAAQVDVALRAYNDFHVGGVLANIRFGWRGAGQAVGSEVVSPENSLEYISDYILKDYSQLEDFSFDPTTNPFSQRNVAIASEVQDLTKGKCKLTTRVSGPMSVAIAIRKPELFLRDLLRNKENAHRLLDFAVECNLKWIQYNLEKFGKINVTISDPGSACNLISQRLFREFSKPHLRKMADGIRNLLGKLPGIHICGKTKAIWEDIAELGFPSFSVDNCEDLAELKAAVGNRMIIAGNVPPTAVLRNGTVNDVIESVKICLIKGSDNPCGFLLMPGCQIPPGTPKENLMAFAYAARRYGRHAQKGRLCGGLVEEGLV